MRHDDLAECLLSILALLMGLGWIVVVGVIIEIIAGG